MQISHQSKLDSWLRKEYTTSLGVDSTTPASVIACLLDSAKQQHFAGWGQGKTRPRRVLAFTAAVAGQGRGGSGQSGTTGTLIFTPLSTKEGDLSFIIRARDNAGPRLGGNDLSGPYLFKLTLLLRYALSVTPDVGGFSQFTTYTFQLSGGTQSVNALGIFHMEFFLMEGNAAAFSPTAVMVRAKSSVLTFTTTAMPPGNSTLFGLVSNSTGVTGPGNFVDTARATVSVGARPSTVSTTSVGNAAALLTTTDPTGAIFQAASHHAQGQNDD